MSHSKKYQFIQNFRKVKVAHAHFMDLFQIVITTVLVLGEIFAGSSIFSLLKFHGDLDLFLEVALVAARSGVVIVLKTNFTNKLSEALAHYKASFLSLNKLNWLVRRYFRTFQVQAIRVPYLLTISEFPLYLIFKSRYRSLSIFYFN
jgi:hypothetical protein